MVTLPSPSGENHFDSDLHESKELWLLESEDVPETPLHNAIIELLVLVLKHFFASRGEPTLVTRNLGCRWDPMDARVGADPDVVVLQPVPTEGEQLKTLRIWEPHHRPPRIAIEVVSSGTAEKDYIDAPARCARLGVHELWVFDPLQDGPASTGGPYILQIWRRTSLTGSAKMKKIHAGDPPAFSPELDAWLVTTQEGHRLRVAHDAEGKKLWPTEAEAAAERAQAETQRAETEARRADAETRRADAETQRANAAQAEIERLRRLLGNTPTPKKGDPR